MVLPYMVCRAYMLGKISYKQKIHMDPSKHWLAFKTSSRHFLKTSSTRLQRNNFSSSKTSCKYVLKTSWKTKNCYAEDVLKTSLRQTKCLLGISLSNKPKSVSDKSISHISISDKSRRIQNALIRTQ